MAGSEGSSSRNSRKRSSIEKEDFVFNAKEEDGDLTEEDALDSGEDVHFKPPSPKPPLIELRGREVIFAISTFFLFSVTIGLIVVLASNKKQLEEEGFISDNGQKPEVVVNEMCVSKECLKAAAQIVQDMDLTVDPCNDFWRYSCGGWLNRHSIPPSYSAWSVDSDILLDMDKKIKAILETPIERDFPESAERKVKQLYRKCMDEDTIDAAGAAPILNIIDSFGGWAIKDDWNLAMKSGLWNFQRFLEESHFSYWVDIFFSLFVAPDERASHKDIIQLDQSSLGISFDREDDDPVFEAYREYMKEIAQLFGADPTSIEEFVNSTFNFEKEFSEIMIPETSEERMTPELMYNPMSIKELKELSPRINWLSFLGHNFSVTENTVVVVASKTFFANMSTLLENTNQRILNYYMVWRLVMQYAKELSKPFRKAAAKFEGFLKGRDREKPRYQFCLEVVDEIMGQAVGAIYIKNHFSFSSKAEVLSIIGNIKGTFYERIKTLPWMDSSTKEEALRKLSAIKYRIGYPEFLANLTQVDSYYRNLRIDKDRSYFDYQLDAANYQVSRMVDAIHGKKDIAHEWEMNPHEINAYYAFTENIMVFPAGILQQPYYRPGVPLYLNYGGIGATIGHELVHGFDTFGSRYDSEGNLNFWWSDEAWEDFQNRTTCIADYYTRYTYDGVSVNGHLTQAENIADIGGLKQTLSAYKKHSAKLKVRLTLPGLALSDEQMFFVAFGQNWCKLQTSDSIKEALREKQHTPNLFRLPGTVSQMKEFADAFRCKPGTPMNPRKKCNLW